jgi:hypothetical protein
MTTIKLKIAQEDKRIMYEILGMIDYPVRIATLDEAIVYETIKSIENKMSVCSGNNKLSLTLPETKAFLHFLDAYETVGSYEYANAIRLRKEIEEKIERILFIIHNS